MTVEGVVPLSAAGDEAVFGAKSANLAAALNARLPVPDGFALSAMAVDHINSGHLETIKATLGLYDGFGGLVAVRSSAIGEDSEGASFAGQHATILGVNGPVDLLKSIMAVRSSGERESASHYRQSMGVETGEARVAVTVQRLLSPTSAGVLFTRNPVNHADERVAEAAWGLGEAVVGSLVTPDHIRFERGGKVVEQVPGQKHILLKPLEGGGTETVRLDPEKSDALCLTAKQIQFLDQLADKCERNFNGAQDIEWAFEGDSLFLLQSRPITTVPIQTKSAPQLQ